MSLKLKIVSTTILRAQNLVRVVAVTVILIDLRHIEGESLKKSKKRSQYAKHRMALKPVAPKEYNGEADPRAYYRFLAEGTAYVIDGKVKSNRRVALLSYYLTEKAYDYYTQKVALDSDQWSLKAFFGGLFNYCFPISFRSDQRRKLEMTF